MRGPREIELLIPSADLSAEVGMAEVSASSSASEK